MKRWVIVPVKRFAAAKSRLSPAVSERRRRALAKALLNHTLNTLRGVTGISGIVVVSRDRAALAAAGKFGALTVREGQCDGLNRALARASAEAVRRGADSVLILPTDLPLLSARDITRAMRMARRPPFVVLAPDRAERGTNLLYVAPPGLIKFSFGERSFQRHRRAARRAGVDPAVTRRPGLAHDIDRPEDLAEIDALPWDRGGRKKKSSR
jgi:2-phospho-L-lactate guanylyltransferase